MTTTSPKLLETAPVWSIVEQQLGLSLLLFLCRDVILLAVSLFRSLDLE